MSVISVEQRIMERIAWGQVALGSERRVNMNDQGHALVSQGLPPLAELARNGKIFTKMVGNGATFKAPLTAIPAIATAATWFLFNDNDATSKACLIPLRAFAYLASGTVAAGLALAVQIPKGAQTRFTADYAAVVESSSIGLSTTSGAWLGNAKTMIGAQGAWELFWNGDNAATATIMGGGITVDLLGERIIKPQYGMALEVISGAGTTPLFGVGVTFAVCDLDVA